MLTEVVCVSPRTELPAEPTQHGSPLTTAAAHHGERKQGLHPTGNPRAPPARAPPGLWPTPALCAEPGGFARRRWSPRPRRSGAAAPRPPPAKPCLPKPARAPPPTRARLHLSPHSEQLGCSGYMCAAPEGTPGLADSARYKRVMDKTRLSSGAARAGRLL